MQQLSGVKSLFHEALSLPAGTDRRRWAEEQCGEDEDLLRDLVSLLEADDQVARANADTPPAAPTPAAPLAAFGPYRAIDLLGRGGMSTVWRARRCDGQFDRTVALKIMAGYIAGPEFERRMAVERRLLASLDHPNITRLLDGGVSSAGDPYLVTEYIEGEPIDTYCDRRKLDLPARLRIFLQVCDAVDYAHRNLIVHRDLKPGNILVNTQGVVKLLDFGTASLLAEEYDVTATRFRMLTPRYASPEQLRGDRMGTATDVFSLAVVLYELLTGAWPFGDPRSILAELNRATQDVTAKPPSTVAVPEWAGSCSASPADLNRMLEGDLGAVILKGLESEPARRYESVRQFAVDIENYLAGRPVTAQPQTVIYRARKFVRRHWLPVAAALLFVVGIALSVLVAVRQARVARAEAAKAEKVNRFLNQMLSSANRYSFDPKKFTVAEMLEAAEGRLSASWHDDPLTEAALRRSLGTSYTAIYRLDRAEFHLQKALAIFSRLGNDLEVVETLNELEGVAVSRGRHEDAAHLAEQCLDRLRKMGGAAPAQLTFRAKDQLATLLYVYMNRRREEARALFAEAIALGTRDPSIPREDLAMALGHFGALQLDEGKYREAESTYRKSLETGRRENPGGFWETLPLNGLARLRARRQEFAAASELARQAYEVSIRNLGTEAPTSGSSKLMWARYRADTGEIGEASEQVAEALPIARKYLSPAINLLLSLGHAAHVMNRAGRFAQAEAYARESLQVAEAAHLPLADWRRADSLLELGAALCGQKRCAPGVAAFGEAEAAYRGLGEGWFEAAERTRQAALKCSP